MLASRSTGPRTTTTLFALALLLGSCGAGGGTSGPPAATTPPVQGEVPHDHDSHDHDDGDDNYHDHETPTQPGIDYELPSEEIDVPPVTATDSGSSAASGSETITMASVWTPLVQGTVHNTAYWPEWWGTGKPLEGVNCLVSAKVHQHMLLSIYKDGKRLGFPDGIGRVHAGCYHAYELHVHDVTGIIHMESDVPKLFKLGHWFNLWQLPLSRDGTAGLPGPARFYLIDAGKITRYDGNPYDIELKAHREVLIVTGTNLTVAPKYRWPAGI